jgi:hypothetical protein
VGNGSLAPLAVRTVGDWVETWLSDTIQPNRSPNRFAASSTMWRHAKPIIGGVKLKDFDVIHVESLIAQLRKTTRPIVLAKVANVLKSAFSVAIRRKKVSVS